MNELEKNETYDNQTFEDIKHIDENGVEYWYARELMPILQYAKWQNFKKIIDKAMIACKNSKISTKDGFTDVSKPMISRICRLKYGICHQWQISFHKLLQKSKSYVKLKA